MVGARSVARGGEEVKFFLFLVNLAPASGLDAGAIRFYTGEDAFGECRMRTAANGG
jgi:hypothetical protein